MEEELDDTLAKVDVEDPRVALREETRKFNAVQRVVKKKEKGVTKHYDRLTTLAADFQLLEIVPSDTATTQARQSSGGRSSSNSASK